MRIIICDDEQIIIDQIREYLICFFTSNKMDSPEIIGYTDGHDLLKDTKTIDILFLDIEMPEINGIHIGRTIFKEQPSVKIFVITSFMEYLDEAMRFHVYRYLSKPIDKHRLFRNLKDVLSEFAHPLGTTDKILISNGAQNKVIRYLDIIFVEAMRHKTKIMTKEGEIISTETMTYWIKKLTYDCFYQTNRSFIVNMNYVSDFKHDTVFLCHNEHSVLLTNKKYSDFKKHFYRYIEKAL